MTIVERIVAFCCRWPWAVIAACLAAGGRHGLVHPPNFAMNTDSEQLIDAKVGWRMRQARFDAAFPQQTNLTLVVIDGATPELAESAAARLTEKLHRRQGTVQPHPAARTAAPSGAKTACSSCP